MSTVRVKDGAEIFYKDWGSGQPIVFSHGWPLNADAWDEQLRFFADQGFRTVAHDRRGHGRSTQTWTGSDMDTYADDLAAVFDHLDLKDAVIIGHSTGGGEVTRYIGRHGTERLAAAILVGAIPPLMLKTEANPLGTPITAFDDLRHALLADRSQFYRDLSAPFYGANRPGSTVSQGVRDAFWMWSMQVGVVGAYDCIKVFSETDLTADLNRFNLPTLFIHGDDDQIVPIQAAARIASTMVPGSTLLTYAGGAHGLTATERDRFNADVLAFVRAQGAGAGRRRAA